MNDVEHVFFLTIQEIILMHAFQIREFGGSHGIRDIGLLDAAIQAPRSTFGGVYLHKDLCEMAAAYIFHIIKNHPFIDGNKRTGVIASLVFLKVNGVAISLTNEEVFTLAIDIALSKVTKENIAMVFRSHQK